MYTVINSQTTVHWVHWELSFFCTVLNKPSAPSSLHSHHNSYLTCVCVPWCMDSPSRQGLWACLSRRHSGSSRRWRSPCRCVCVSVSAACHTPWWWSESPRRAERLHPLGSDVSSANEMSSCRLKNRSETSSHCSLLHPDHSPPPTERQTGRDKQKERQTDVGKVLNTAIFMFPFIIK